MKEGVFKTVSYGACDGEKVGDLWDFPVRQPRSRGSSCLNIEELDKSGIALLKDGPLAAPKEFVDIGEIDY